MPSVSWSEVKTFRRCMKAHDYKYTQRLKKKKKAVPLLKGSILHEMLDAHYKVTNLKARKSSIESIEDAGQVLDRYEEKYKDLFLEEQETYGDIIGDCEKIFQAYLKYYKEDPLSYKASEVFVSTPLADDITLIGYIDKIAVDDKGRHWLVDHKFTKSIPHEDETYHELQLLIYVWAWERSVHGGNGKIKIDGIIWDHARTKIPATPELLKKGGLSQRKNMDTTASIYMTEIGKHGLDPADYVEMLQHLQGNEDKFFRRIILPRPPQDMINEIVEDFRTTAVMIQKMKGIAPRSMSNFNCRICEFRPLCEAEVRGHDADFIKKSEYTPRDEHGDEDDASQEEEA